MQVEPRLAAQNIQNLKQGLSLLDAVDDKVFTHVDPEVYQSPVGEHVRHALDHYIVFFEQLEAGDIDYENRPRNPDLGSKRGAASSCIEELISSLSALSSDDVDRPLRIRMECGTEGEGRWAPTTMGRELDFLLSHTIHHYGLIAMILRLQGVAPDTAFGVAPSTIRYQEKSASCAP